MATREQYEEQLDYLICIDRDYEKKRDEAEQLLLDLIDRDIAIQ